MPAMQKQNNDLKPRKVAYHIEIGLEYKYKKKRDADYKRALKIVKYLDKQGVLAYWYVEKDIPKIRNSSR